MVERTDGIGGLVERAREEDETLTELEELAEEEPERLAPFLERLMGFELSPTVFASAGAGAGADDAVQRLLVERVETGEYIGGAPSALARARGPVAEAAFRRWRQEPPAGLARLFFTVDQYMRTGDWELTPDGVRELHGHTVFALDRHAASRVPCPSCDRPLDVLLDVDTHTEPAAAEALSHPGWSGRLRIALCEPCDHSTETPYPRVTPDGTGQRTDATGRLPTTGAATRPPAPQVPLDTLFLHAPRGTARRPHTAGLTRAAARRGRWWARGGPGPGVRGVSGESRAPRLARYGLRRRRVSGKAVDGAGGDGGADGAAYVVPVGGG